MKKKLSGERIIQAVEKAGYGAALPGEKKKETKDKNTEQAENLYASICNISLSFKFFANA